jgi:hypothetical protein
MDHQQQPPITEAKLMRLLTKWQSSTTILIILCSTPWNTKKAFTAKSRAASNTQKRAAAAEVQVMLMTSVTHTPIFLRLQNLMKEKLLESNLLKSQHFWCQNEIYQKKQEGHHNRNQAPCFRLSSPSTTIKLTSATKTSYCQQNHQIINIKSTSNVLTLTWSSKPPPSSSSCTSFLVNLWVLLPTKSNVLVAFRHLFQGHLFQGQSKQGRKQITLSCFGPRVGVWLTTQSVFQPFDYIFKLFAQHFIHDLDYPIPQLQASFDMCAHIPSTL